METNVAKSSTKGHYVNKNSKPVICLDSTKEAFFVEGDAILSTENHQTLNMESDCLIMPQQVYNPYTKYFERSKD